MRASSMRSTGRSRWSGRSMPRCRCWRIFRDGWRFWLVCAIAFYFGLRSPLWLSFLFGALAAVAVERGLLGGRLASAWLAPLPVAAFAACFLFPQIYALWPGLLLFIFFLFVVDGNPILGLLDQPAGQAAGRDQLQRLPGPLHRGVRGDAPGQPRHADRLAAAAGVLGLVGVRRPRHRRPVGAHLPQRRAPLRSPRRRARFASRP